MGRQKRAKRRANGEGTLILRGGYYYAIWYVNGKKIVRTTKCSDKREAEKVLAEFVRPTQAKSDIEKLEAIKARIEDIKSGNLEVGRDKPIKIKFILSEYEDDLSRKSPLTESSKAIYEWVIKKLDTFASKIDKEYVYQLTKEDAKQFFTENAKTISATSYNSLLKCIKSMIKVIIKHDNNIKCNVFEDIPSKAVDKSRGRRELSEKEIDKLIECAGSINEETKLFFLIGAYTGLRKSDAAKLKWSEVDLQTKMIRKLPSKTKRNGMMAHVPICKTLFDVLSNMDKKTEYVLPTISTMTKMKVTSIINRVFKKAGIEIISKDENGVRYMSTGFHAFRHSLASRLSREGMPIPQIQMIMAHTSVNMSLHYSHANESDLVLPEIKSDTTSVRIKKSLIEELSKKNVTVDQVIEEWLQGKVNVVKNEIEELKKKEEKEIDEMIDEIFSEKSTTMIDNEKQK